MKSLIPIAAIALGGALGSCGRYLMSVVMVRGIWPWGTFLVNVVGSALAGFLLGVMGDRWSQGWRLGIMTGFLGGFTTFSAFSMEVGDMVQRGALWLAAGYILLSVSLAVLAFFTGLWLGRALRM